MRIHLQNNVMEEALKRIRYIFDEFPIVVVGVSGGKDSTVVLNLALKVAREKNRLPLKVMFVDQEAEWTATIDMIKEIMYSPDVEPYWYQMPIQLFNASSFTEHWLWCWQEGKEWIRPKDPISIKENKTGNTRFAKCFPAIMKYEYPKQKACYLSGVRAEESPGRAMGLTFPAKYKWVTWGKTLDKEAEQYTFYPIYDWRYTDVWKAIHQEGWHYNKIYDIQYQNGVQIGDMRVSNLHHETAVHSLFYLQEADPELYNKLTERLQGIDTAGKMGWDDYFVRQLPFMFRDWIEYRDYLCEHLIDNPDWKKKFKESYARYDKLFLPIPKLATDYAKMCVQSILTNDWEFVKVKNWFVSPNVHYIIKNKLIKNGSMPK